MRETGLDGSNSASNYQVSSAFNYTTDNILLFSECQLSELSQSNREDLVRYLSSNLEVLFGLENHDTYQYLLINVLETIPAEDRLHFYNLFKNNPDWIRKIYYDISNDLKKDIVRIWLGLWSQYYTSNQPTESSAGKLVLKENIFSNASNLAMIEEGGSIIILDPYQHGEEPIPPLQISHPFETIYLYKPEHSEEKPFVTLPAIAAVLFLDQEHIKTYEDLGWTSVNIALYAVGIGEVYIGIRGAALAYETGGVLSRQFLLGSSRALLGAADIAAGITTEHCADENSEFCQTWAQYQFYINLGLLTASVADIMYVKISDSYAKSDIDFTPQQMEYLEDELGLARTTSQIDIPPGLINKLGGQVSELENWLAKYGTGLGDNATTILNKIDDAISNKVVLKVKEDNAGRFLVQTEGVNRNNVHAIIKKKDGTYTTHDFIAYKPSANPDIDVPLSDNLLAPDYSGTKYLYDITGTSKKNIVKIKMTGKRQTNSGDFYAANTEAGFVDEFGSKAPTKIIEGERVQYTWHHLDDLIDENGDIWCTMQLVEADAHTKVKGFGHSGSVAQYQVYTGENYE